MTLDEKIALFFEEPAPITELGTFGSLFMLRRCASAEAFSRAYTSSGMFFRVSVVGMSISNRFGTILVPGRRRRQACGKHPQPFQRRTENDPGFLSLRFRSMAISGIA